MKFFYQLLGILLLCLVASHSVLAQGPSCQTATPMCNDITPYPVNFTGTGAGTGPQAPAGPNYNCLLTTPSPTYFTITITQSGTIQFDIENTNVVDIDFILWGPFTDLFAANAACNSLGNGGIGGSVIDCSYDPQAFETVNITNAIAGQVYIMMITNYANVATNVYSTPNVGTGQLGCPCQLDANFSIAPLPNGTGTMTSSTNGSAEFKVCPGDTLYFNVGVGADNIADTLSIFASLTSIANVFTPSQFEIFGPFYPNAPLQDTMDFIVMITPGATQTGIYNFSLGVENTGTSDCFDSYPITVVIPGIPNLPPGDTICSGGTYDLVAGSFPVTASGTNTYLWTQISGPAATITNGTSSTATISPPVLPAGDSMRFQLLYNYGGCVFKDTIKIYGYDIDINMTAAPNPVCAGQPVNLTAVLSDTVGVVTTTTCTPSYTFALIPFAPVAAGGTTVTLGNDAISTARPIGFPFKFYCNDYTQFYIGSNGFVTFSAGAPGGVWNQFIPNAAAPNNLIALNWTDLDPSSGGTIRYQTLGVAPNRRLVVTFTNVPTYWGNDLVTVQMILYEGTNIIEEHVTYAADNFDFIFPSDPITIGIENATGTVASSPGVNATSGIYQNQAVRYTPNITTTTTFSPITYAWTPTNTLNNSTIYNPIASPTAPTSYHVTIQNGACSFSDSIQVNITGSLPAPTVTCGTSTYTTIQFNWTALALPGGGFYQYSTNGGATWTSVGTALTATLTGLAPGTTVTILVRGNNGLGTPCSPGAPGTVTCSTLPCILSLTDTKEHVICFGEATGTIDLTPANGTIPYGYSWSTGATTQDLLSLPAGTYNVTVSDAVGCTATRSIIVTQPAKGLGLTFNLVNPVCNGTNTGCAAVNVAYGTGNYSYNWSNGIGFSADSICGLAAGTYMLTVTDTVMAGSAGGIDTIYFETFQGVHNWTLNVSTGANGAEPNVWEVNDTESGVAPPGCGTGGTGDQTLHITCTSLFCGTFITGAVYNATETSNVRAESPAFSTMGLSNMTLSFNFIANGDALLDNASLLYNDGVGGWQVLTPSLKSAVCGSGQGQWTAYSIALPVSCNNKPNVRIGFNWTNNADNIGTDPSIAINNILLTTPMTGVGAKYCFAYDTITLTQPTAIAITLNGTTNASCNGSSNGTATVSAVGGSGAFSYAWSSGATTATATGLAANIYTVTVTDTNSCVMTRTVTITQPSVLTAAVDSTDNPTCNGTSDGAIYIQVNGGTIGYSYAWTGGVTSQDLTGIPSGTYNVTITDANGCTTTLSQSITQPGAVSVAIDSSNNVSCNGANNAYISASGSSGTPNYSYAWSNGLSSATITGLGGGTYIVTISDQNGCTDTALVVIAEPTALAVTDSVGTINCNGDSTGVAVLNVSGGTVGYSYMWSNGDLNPTLTGVPAGIYTATITDANNCVITNTVTFTEPSALTAMVDSTISPTCNGTADGGIYITVAGGTTNYIFNWTGSVNSEDLTSIPSGNYSVTVTDANGCITTIDTSINQPGAVSAVIDSAFNISCAGANDGIAFANGISGIPGYSFVWTGGQATAMATGLTAGVYVVTITDQNNCTDTASVTITEPTVLSATSTSTNVNCNGASTGTASVTPNGGTGSYSYNWSGTGAITQSINNVAAGVYTVTVTDVNGCMTTSTVTITEPAIPFVVSLQGTTNLLCNGDADGDITVNATGGTGAATYNWNIGQSGTVATGLTAGVYTVTATDANLCTSTLSITVTEPSAISVTANPTNVTCGGVDNGTIAVTASGGTNSFTYSWSGSASGQNNATATGLAAGNYTATITDGNACEATVTATVNPSVPLDSATVPLTVVTGVLDCQLNPVGVLSINPVSGTGYTYSWSTGATDASASGLAAGTHTVTITNSSGCTITQTGTVLTPFVPNVNPFVSVTGTSSVTITTDNTVNIDGGNDQSGSGVTYIWTSSSTDITIGNNTSHTTTAVSSTAGTYTLTITATAGTAPNCTDAGIVTIVFESSFVGVPTAFTPNGDGTNDLFLPVGLNAREIEVFKVFNRWGQLLYDGSDLQGGGWDGKYLGAEQPSEVYLYLVQYKLGSAESKILRGDFTLMR